MKKRTLILISALPIPLGYIMEFLIMKFAWAGLMSLIISTGFFLLWIYIGQQSVSKKRPFITSLLYAHSIAIVCLALILIQHSTLQNVPQNLLGLIPQMYYLPMLYLTSSIVTPLLFFIEVLRFEYFVIPAFLLMLCSFTIGYRMKLKRRTVTHD